MIVRKPLREPREPPFVGPLTPSFAPRASQQVGLSSLQSPAL